jgi:hypothetical protein
MQRERLAHTLYDCFDPAQVLPLVDRYVARQFSDPEFGRRLFNSLRATATHPLERVMLSDWIPDIESLSGAPDPAALLPQGDLAQPKLEEEPTDKGGPGIFQRLVRGFSTLLRTFKDRWSAHRHNSLTLRAA